MNKKNLIGTFTLNSCPDVTEIISKNLDYVIIDREHGSHSLKSANILNKIIKQNCLSLRTGECVGLLKWILASDL